MEKLQLLIIALLALYFGAEGLISRARSTVAGDGLLGVMFVVMVSLGTVGLLVAFGFVGVP